MVTEGLAVVVNIFCCTLVRKMAYIVPIHRPTSVRHALKLRLLSSEEECLVLAYVLLATKCKQQMLMMN